MGRGFKPVKSSSDRSNLFVQGSNDPLLKRYLGETLLAKLGGKKPARPANNFEAARMYYESQQKKK